MSDRNVLPPRLLAAGPTHYDKRGPNTEYALWVGDKMVGLVVLTPGQHAALEATFAELKAARDQWAAARPVLQKVEAWREAVKDSLLTVGAETELAVAVDTYLNGQTTCLTPAAESSPVSSGSTPAPGSDSLAGPLVGPIRSSSAS